MSAPCTHASAGTVSDLAGPWPCQKRRVSQHSLCLSFLAGQRVTSRRRAFQAKGYEFYLECSAVEVHSEACRDLLVTGEAPLHSGRGMSVACSASPAASTLHAKALCCLCSPAALQPRQRLALRQGRHNSSEAPRECSSSSIPACFAGSLHQPRLAVSNDALEGWHVAGLSARSASSPVEMHGLLASAYVARDRSHADLGAMDEHSAVVLKVRLAQFVPATEDQDEDSAVVRGAGDWAS